jgi:hypothetical protein
MNKSIDIRLIFLIPFLFVCQLVFAQKNNQDTLKSIKTTGFFEGKKITVGNFETEEVYKINEYCIYLKDISPGLLDSLKGKKVFVSGKLKIVVGKTMPAKSSNDGKIYEPYKEPDKKFIVNPKFTLLY